MRAWELLVESSGRKKINEAMAMREYAHPEEYLIRDGVDAGIEILQELKDDIAQPETLNVKWDGKAAIFWGRDEQGQFYMIPNNQWNKGQKLSQEELAGEIQRTGRKLSSQSDEEFAAIRSQMAANYSAQWNALEKSSPRQGFYWGDIMFDAPPEKNKAGEYEFTPNKITYTVDPSKELGRAISKGAKIFIAVHGLVPEFGVDPTSDLKPVSQEELSALNQKNSEAYLLSERPQQRTTSADVGFIDQAIEVLAANKQTVDAFMAYTAPKFTGFRNILRDYINNKIKNKGNLDFPGYIESAKLSESQKKMATDYVIKNPAGIKAFDKTIGTLISAKNKALAELQTSHSSSMADRLGISANVGGTPGGEGYAKIRKSGAGIKYVNPDFRSAAVNARFSG